MASTALTLAESPATIESDTTEARITKDPELRSMEGYLFNVGGADVFCKAAIQTTGATGVSTALSQGQLQFVIPAGGQFQWLPHYNSVAHKCTSGTAALIWEPLRRTRI